MTIITRIFFFFFILSLLTVSCCKDEIPLIQTDENGVIITQSYQWKFSLHAGNIFHSNGHFDYPIIYNQNIAIPTTGIDGAQYITMINSSDGKAQWTWNDPDCSFVSIN